MIKYAINSECNMKCPYCVMRNVHRVETYDLLKTKIALESLSSNDNEIMMTGGEPTISPCFLEKLHICASLFDRVFLTTANASALNWSELSEKIAAITFSLHGRKPEKLPRPKITAYASEMAHLYKPGLPEKLHERGWSGFTVNEDHRAEYNGHFDETKLPEIEGFSYRINRAGSCMEKTTIMLPDLDVIDAFWELL